MSVKDLKGTKTEANLNEAFAGESMARNKYTFYADKAREEGMEQIANFFMETARNEQQHAFLWFEHLQKNGEIQDTDHNLKDAAEGENYEWTDMYVRMAADAREEGFTKIAAQMDLVATIEKQHEERYLKLRDNVRNDEVFTKPEETVWECQICGHKHTGTSAPQRCPLCAYEQAFFEVDVVSY